MHSYPGPVMFSRHSPPFRHGRLLHSFTSERNLTTDYQTLSGGKKRLPHCGSPSNFFPKNWQIGREVGRREADLSPAHQNLRHWFVNRSLRLEARTHHFDSSRHSNQGSKHIRSSQHSQHTDRWTHTSHSLSGRFVRWNDGIWDRNYQCLRKKHT
jgi:hypothetical protein